MSQPVDILFCHCAHADVVDADVRRAVREALSASGASVRDVPDLCGLAAKRDPLLKELAAADSLKVVACFPRAVKWLFAAAAAPLDDDRADVFNMRTQSTEEILASLLDEAPASAAATDAPAVATADGWLPWFPVIDYDRCTGCKQCMNFCLFSVYGVTPDGRVTVSTPAACKTHCPACARICPEAAIIFPKYAAAPFNGDEVGPDAPGEAAKVDVKTALGGDVYAALRKRSGGNGDEQQALAERTACANLKDIQQQLDIPDEVINSLNPPESLRQAVCDCENCDCAGMPDEMCDCDCDCACAAPGDDWAGEET